MGHCTIGWHENSIWYQTWFWRSVNVMILNQNLELLCDVCLFHVCFHASHESSFAWEDASFCLTSARYAVRIMCIISSRSRCTLPHMRISKIHSYFKSLKEEYRYMQVGKIGFHVYAVNTLRPMSSSSARSNETAYWFDREVRREGELLCGWHERNSTFLLVHDSLINKIPLLGGTWWHVVQ
jgi:hypothetical protein